MYIADIRPCVHRTSYCTAHRSTDCLPLKSLAEQTQTTPPPSTNKYNDMEMIQYILLLKTYKTTVSLNCHETDVSDNVDPFPNPIETALLVLADSPRCCGSCWIQTALSPEECPGTSLHEHSHIHTTIRPRDNIHHNNTSHFLVHTLLYL